MVGVNGQPAPVPEQVLPPQRRLRNRVLALVLLPLLGVLPLLGLVLLWWSTAAVDGLLRTKVRADLAVAHELKQAGEPVKVLFAGAATRWPQRWCWC